MSNQPNNQTQKTETPVTPGIAVPNNGPAKLAPGVVQDTPPVAPKVDEPRMSQGTPAK